MSNIVQLLCGLALVAGATIIVLTTNRNENDQVKWAADFILLGIPFLGAYVVGATRKILCRLDELETKINSVSKDKAA